MEVGGGQGETPERVCGKGRDKYRGGVRKTARDI